MKPDRDFAQMITLSAWKRLEKWAEEESDRSMRMIDGISAKDLSVNHVCEERGLRKGILKVIQYANGQAEGR